MKACKPALESSYITKVIHDCKRDSEVSMIDFYLVMGRIFFSLFDTLESILISQALYYQFGIKLNNVVDTQVHPLLQRILDTSVVFLSFSFLALYFTTMKGTFLG